MRVGDFIKERRLKAGLSAKEAAKRAGVSDAHILYIEKEKRKPTFDVLVRILNALGVSMEEFLKETGYMEANVEAIGAAGRLFKIPVVSWVTAGRWKEVCDAFEPGDADEWIDSDVKGKSVFALRVTGDSMEPEFKEGEIIIVTPHVDVNPNDFIVVKNKDGEATFKQLKKYGTKWVLHPLNSRYPDLEVRRGDFTIIGRVVKKEKRY
ncbi:MAG: XRE family transcriptional regulator [Thermodesulfovibrionales bacterium]|nr:XRE family transcriptional regulator [Thermodesulfovibrionales bacterium]